MAAKSLLDPEDTVAWKRSVARVVAGVQYVYRVVAIGASHTVGVGTKSFDHPELYPDWKPNDWGENLGRFLTGLFGDMAKVEYTNAAVRGAMVWLHSYCLDSMVRDHESLDLVGISLNSNQHHWPLLLNRLAPRSQVFVLNHFNCALFKNETWEEEFENWSLGVPLVRQSNTPQFVNSLAMKGRFHPYGVPPWTCMLGGPFSIDRHHMSDFAHQMFAQLVYRWLLRAMLELTPEDVRSLAAQELPKPRISNVEGASCNLSLPEYNRPLKPDPAFSRNFELRPMAREKEYWASTDAHATFSFVIDGAPSYMRLMIIHSPWPSYGGALVQVLVDGNLALNYTTYWTNVFSIISPSTPFEIPAGPHRVDVVSIGTERSNTTMIFGYFTTPVATAAEWLINTF